MTPKFPKTAPIRSDAVRGEILLHNQLMLNPQNTATAENSSPATNGLVRVRETAKVGMVRDSNKRPAPCDTVDPP